MNWTLSHRADPATNRIAKRHYSCQHPDSDQFMPPGRCLVLLADDGSAAWGTSWPFAQYVKHEWAGAWMNSLFRNEGGYLSSELIRQAVACSIWYFGPPPLLGMVTFIDTRKVRATHPGYCYKKAGFRQVGMTKGGLLVFQLLPSDMPQAQAPIGAQLALEVAG